MGCPLLRTPLENASLAHFRPFRGKIRACIRSQTRRRIIFYPIYPFFIFNFRSFNNLNSKKSCIKCPLLGSSTVHICNSSQLHPEIYASSMQYPCRVYNVQSAKMIGALKMRNNIRCYQMIYIFF